MTTDTKIKESLTTQLEKENIVEAQLAQQELEWKKEGHKAQLETNSLIRCLAQNQRQDPRGRAS
jgi:hypothetical protein